nr:chondroitin proteoglycan 1-like [Aedes albopictus]
MVWLIKFGIVLSAFYLNIAAYKIDLTLGKPISDTIQVVPCTSTVANIWENQPHPDYCHFYISCMNNIGIVQTCLNDLYFNAITRHCDYPENVDCENPSTPTEPDLSTTDSTDEIETSEPTDATDTTVEGEITTEESTTETTTEDSTTEDSTTEDSTTEDSTTEDSTTEDSTTEDSTTEDSTTEDSTTEDSTTEDSTTEDSTTEDSTTEDSTTEDSTTEDSTTEDSTTEDSTTEDSTTEDSTTEDSTTEDSTTEDSTTEDSTTEDSTTEDSTTEDSTTEDSSTDFSTVEDNTTEETTTQPTTEQFCEPLCAGQDSEVADPENCSRFISCIDKCSGAVQFCPEGLHFNHHWSVCDLPQRAECLLEVCLGEPTELIPSVNSCRSYYECSASNANLRSCETGYVFDSTVLGCVLEDAHNACQIEDIPGAPQEVYNLCTTLVEDQLLPHPSRCDVYYRCVRGMLSPRMCLEGLLFDTQRGMCNLEDRVECNPEISVGKNL